MNLNGTVAIILIALLLVSFGFEAAVIGNFVTVALFLAVPGWIWYHWHSGILRFWCTYVLRREPATEPAVPEGGGDGPADEA